MSDLTTESAKLGHNMQQHDATLGEINTQISQLAQVSHQTQALAGRNEQTVNSLTGQIHEVLSFLSNRQLIVDAASPVRKAQRNGEQTL